MDSLPVEIKRFIAFYLRNCDESPHGPCDIKNFRLVNKEFSAIGAEYLLPEIHLTFQTQSFERLRTVSQHPFYSRRVKSLYYEPDAFGNMDMNVFNQIRNSPEATFIRDRKRPEQPPVFKDKEAKLVYDRELKAFNAEITATQVELDRKCKAYEVVCSDQMAIRNQDDPYNRRLVAQAMARLPKLTEVTVNFEQGILPQTNAFKRAYADTIVLPAGDNGHNFPYGVMQLSSILCGAASAGTRLKTLNCGTIDWKFLDVDEKSIEAMKRAVQHLDTFRMAFYAESHFFISNSFLKTYRIANLISAAKDLKILSLRNDLRIDQRIGLNLKYMIGTTTWASLRVVELNAIYAEEENLISFLERHAGTLKELGLHRMILVIGSWISALSRIQKALKLDEFRAVGTWFALSPSQRWKVDTSLDLEQLQESISSLDCSLGLAIRKYVIKGGMNPLLDSVTHPQRS